VSEKNSKAQRQKERRMTRMLCVKSQLLSLPNRLEGRRRWRVARVGRKTTIEVIVWGRIGFHNSHLRILHHDSILP
jgi:hypothetical protein